jgi:hypothetical protein
MSRGDAFSGVALTPPLRMPDRWAQRPIRRRFFRNSNSIAGTSVPAHTAIRYRRAFFCTRRELDGAEEINGAET